MKTVFDRSTREELKARINTLDEKSERQWGKMSVYQMMKHCTLWDEMILSGDDRKQVFMGRLFGKMALRRVLKDDAPLKHSTPTLPELVIRGDGNITAEKKKWIGLIDQYEYFTRPQVMHAFFGKMTKEQIGQLAHKHTDHHLRQFNS